MASVLSKAKLLNPDGSDYTKSLDGKFLMLYFSASWCPRCKTFSPLLIEWYAAHAAKQNCEIVFVSSDRDAQSFSAYAKHFPFPAITFEDRNTKIRLSSQFGITSIPSLIVLDPEGHLISKNGREGVTAQPASFPWRPKSLPEILSGELEVGGARVDALSHLRGKKVALYFSAIWCGPCKRYAPLLAALHQSLAEAGKKFEVVFVSADRDEAGFRECLADKKWAAIPFGDPRIEALNSHFEIEGIPTTILIDGDTFRVLHSELRSIVAEDPRGNRFPWAPEAVAPLAPPFLSHINEVASALIFVPSSDLIALATEAARPAAQRVLDEAEKTGKNAALRFAVASSQENDLADSIRSFTNQLPQKEPEVLLLDIPNARKFVLRNVKLTAEFFEHLTRDFLAGTLPGQKSIKEGDFVPKPPAAGAHTHGHGGNCAGHGHGGHEEEEEEEEEEAHTHGHGGNCAGHGHGHGEEEEEEEEEHGHSHDHNAPGHSHHH